MHLSRLGAEIVLWSSDEFSFCELAEDFSSGSSIMPQKKNPDAAELLRAKAPRIASGFLTLAGVHARAAARLLEGPPGGQGGAFDAVDNLELCLEAAERMLGGLASIASGSPRRPPTSSRPRPTIADLLVRKGMPFREAHGVVGGLVREALEQGKTLSELTPEELRGHSELLDDSYYEALRPERWLESKARPAAPRSARLAEQLEAAGAVAASEIRRERAALASRAARADFFDRSVHDVARDLIGCALLFDGVGGVIVECESYERDDPACHAYVGLTRANRAPVRAPRARLRVPLLRGPLLPQLRLRAGGRGGGGADPGAGAAVGDRGDVPASRPRWGRELCSGPGKLTEALGIGLEMNRAPLAEPPFELRGRDHGWRDVEVATGPRSASLAPPSFPGASAPPAASTSRGRWASGRRRARLIPASRRRRVPRRCVGAAAGGRARLRLGRLLLGVALLGRLGRRSRRRRRGRLGAAVDGGVVVSCGVDSSFVVGPGRRPTVRRRARRRGRSARGSFRRPRARRRTRSASASRSWRGRPRRRP